MGADALPDGVHILNGLTLDEWALGQQQEITMALGQYQSSYSQLVELDITRIFGPHERVGLSLKSIGCKN